MNLIPLGNRVILKPIRLEDKERESGIVIPEKVQQQKKEATVVALGPDVASEQLKIGSHVIFTYGAEEFENDGEKLLICEDSEIIAIIL